MHFRGGVIIVGSLIWDTSIAREKWRRVAFINSVERIKVPVKIRYGRESRSRSDTYSMIFSNHPSTEFGEAFILEFKDPIKSFKNLEEQAYNLAQAEGIYRDHNERTLLANWGAVGVLFNPDIEGKDKRNSDFLKNKWKGMYRGFNKMVPDKYTIDKSEMPVITEEGFLHIDWVEEMDDFDLLLATPTVPNTGRPLTAREIADRMNEKKYWDYFSKNRDNQISTFQDIEISKFLNS